MAEQVQGRIEQFVPELRELEQRKLFTPAEIQMIVKKRTDFEYLLAKRTCVKEDFLHYIQYEMQLEALRHIRKDKLNIKGKKALTDYSIVQHVQSLFDRATKKFPGDMSLWLSFVEYCKSTGSHKVVNQVMARMLQFQPRNPYAWLIAAKYEWEEVQSTQAARVLFQRALRLMPKDKLLWQEYIRMETFEVQKGSSPEVLQLVQDAYAQVM